MSWSKTRYVNFTGGDFESLDFYDTLDKAFRDDVNLDIMLSQTETPTIYVWDTNYPEPNSPASSKNTLYQVRMKVEQAGAGKLSHQIEKGKYLSKILADPAYEPKPAAQPAGGQPAP